MTMIVIVTVVPIISGVTLVAIGRRIVQLVQRVFQGFWDDDGRGHQLVHLVDKGIEADFEGL